MAKQIKKTITEIRDEGLLLNRWGQPMSQSYINRLKLNGKLKSEIDKERNVTLIILPQN